MTDIKARIPDQIDLHVSKRIRERRQLLGISQEHLAAQCGVTFQQIQKREAGTNRLSASALYKTASVLRVPVEYFFAGLPEAGGAPHDDPMTDSTSIEVVKLFRKRTPQQRETLLSVLRTGM